MTMLATYGIYRTSVMASEFAIKAQAEDSTRAIVQGFEEQIAKMEELRKAKEMAAYDSDIKDAMSTGTISEDMGAIIQSMRDELRLEEQLAKAARDNAEAQVQAAKNAVDATQKAVEAAQEQVKAADEHLQKAMESLDLQEIAKAREEESAAQIALTTATREHEAAALALSNAETAAATAQTELNSAAERANAASVIANTSATTGNTAAQTVNTAAQSRNAVVTALVTAKNKAATVAQHLWTGAVNMTTKAVNALKVAWVTNPIGLVITALTTAIGLFMTFKDNTEEASAEVERFGEAASKTKRNIDTLYAVLDSVSKDSKVYRDSLDELTKIAKEYGITIDAEKDTLDQLIEKRAILNDLILKEGEARQIANRIASYQEDKKGYIEDFVKNMTESIEDESDGEAEENAGRFAQMIADKVERDLQDVENGKMKGMVEHWNDLEAQLKVLQQNIEYDETGQVSADYERKKKQLREDIAQIQEDIAVAANSEAKAFAKQMGMAEDYQLDIKDTAKYVKELTDKIVVTNKFIDQTKANAKKVQEELDAVKPPEPDFSAVGMDVNNLVKNFKDFKKQLDEVDDTEVKPTVDASELDAATESADEAKDSVDNLDASSATPTTDNSQVDATTDSALTAANAMKVLDNTEAEPVIKTTWLDGFTTKVNDAWGGLQKFLGVENPEPLIKSNKAQTPAKTPKQKAQTAIDDIKTEFKNKVNNAKTSNQFTEIRKGINSLMGDLDQGSADWKFFDNLLKSLDKRDKSKNKSKGNDDPKQRAYEVERARLEEERRTAEQVLAEQNRLYQLGLDMRRDTSDKEIDVIRFEAKKKREALIKERQKEADRLKEFDRQQWLKENKNRKAYQWVQTKSDEEYLTQAGVNIGYNTQYSAISVEEEDDVRRVQKEIAATMLSYLKEFGTFQQKRFAIEQDYEEKIINARNEGERLSLESQRKSELQKLDIEALKQQIDWGSMFGDFGTMMSDQVQPTIDKLEAITKTDEFRNSTFEEQKAVYELISTLKGTITEWDSNIYSTLGDAVTAYQTALRENADAVDVESLARKKAEEKARRLREIEEKNRIARAKGEQVDMEAENVARQEFEEAITELGTAAARTSQTTSNLADAQQNLSDATTTARNMFSQLVSGLQGLSSGSLQGVWSGLNQLSKLFSGNDNLANKMGGALLEGMQKLFGDDSKIGKEVSKALSAIGGPMMGEIVGIFFSILDILKDGIGNFIAPLIDTVLGAVNGLLNSVLSGEIITSVGKSVIQGVGNILDTVSFGGFSSLMNSLGLSGDSDKNLERDIERLTATNDALRRAVDNLANEMRDAPIAEVVSMYATQKSDLEQSMKNTQEMMSRSGSAYSNGFLGIGGHHSSNYKIDKGMGSGDWARISTILNKSVRSAGDFWRLTSEQMAKVAQSAPDLYVKIKGLADDGYKNAAQFMDEYIEYYKELEELENAYRESLTDVSFDSVKDEFKSMLLDMESDTEDFAENFEKMMQQAVINSLMNRTYNDAIQKWYSDFAEAMKRDERLTAEEQAKLKSQWDNIVSDAINERDNIKKAMGWDSSSTQQSSSRTLAGMSQDTGNAIEGRLTALQIAVESIRTSEAQHTMSLADLDDKLLQIALENNKYNIHCDNIERQMAKMYIELQTISENTGAIVKPIQSMQQSLDRIERHTKNL